MREDDFSEFLIALEKSIGGIVKNYEEKLSAFPTYFSNVVHAQAAWWKQKNGGKVAKRAVGETLHNEALPECADDGTDRILERNTASRAAQFPRDAGRMTREHLMVLALRASSEITDNLIGKVATAAGCDEDDLRALISSAKESMKKKTERLEMLQERRDRAYFRRRSAVSRDGLCAPEARAEPDASYAASDKRWKSAVEDISQMSLAPSKTAVGRLLGMSPRRVSKLLNEAFAAAEEEPLP